MQVYFLYTGNACRSQLAEALTQKLLPGWRVQSAGVQPTAADTMTVEELAKRGIDWSHAQAKPIDMAYLNGSDVVVTLCGDARDHCPVLPPTTRALHWPLADPAQVLGAARADAFTAAADQIETLIQRTWLTENSQG